MRLNYSDEELLKQALLGNIKILKDERIDKIRDNMGWTPLHILASWTECLTKKILKKRFPWYTFKEKETIWKNVDNIVNTSNSVKFIGGI